MQQHIPDDLGQEVAKLAEGLELDLDQVVREALEGWVKRVRQSQSKRMPDPCIIVNEACVPYDLPRSALYTVQVIRAGHRLPDGVGLGYAMYYQIATQAPIAQGEIFDGCPILFWQRSASGWIAAESSERVVTLTQACDLANEKTSQVQVAIVHDANWSLRGY